jgi:preprotein translocase YajC subunit
MAAVLSPPGLALQKEGATHSFRRLEITSGCIAASTLPGEAMFATPAFAQTAAGAASGGPQAMLMQFLPLIALVVLFYFLMIRPQQKRLKDHQNMIANLKRGDTVVLNSGVIGKVVRVEDKEVGLDIATNVTVKVVKGMIAEVRGKGEPAAANDAKTPNDVVSFGMGTQGQRYSPMQQINTETVRHLVPAWSMSFGGEKQRGQESQPLIHNGRMFVTASYSRLFAIDAKTGKKLWRYEHRLPDGIMPCCDVVNRGAALYGDLVIFATLDAQLVALHQDTGKVVWKEKIGDYAAGYSATAAPLVKAATRTGKKKNALTPTTFSLLHATDFADRLMYMIIPPLKAGMVVLADRYAYTAFARDVARGVDRQWVRALYSFAVRPDLALYFRVPIDVSVERLMARRVKLKYYEAGMDMGWSANPIESFRLFQSRVLDEYDGLVAEYGLQVIDAVPGIPEQQRVVRRIASRLLERPHDD